MENQRDVLEQLNDFLNRRGLKINFLAKEIGISQRGYSHYETGENNIPNNILIKLAYFYNTSIDYILGITNEKKPYSKKTK